MTFLQWLRKEFGRHRLLREVVERELLDTEIELLQTLANAEHYRAHANGLKQRQQRLRARLEELST